MTKRIEVEKGEVFGELVIIGEVDQVRGKRRFLCQCGCGDRFRYRLDHLRSGRSKSCGGCGVEWEGKHQPLSEWALESGVAESTLRSRMKTMDLGEAMARG